MAVKKKVLTWPKKKKCS